MPDECICSMQCAANSNRATRDEGGKRVVGKYDDAALRGDGQLLACDLLDGVAEHIGVLEPHAREQDDARAQDVRRVEPPAEPRFDDGVLSPIQY